ncbi:hypothetical protein [Leptospira santarosai]|uniref:hypothetical protein n=1 Tax=Leptospira santarosai TaxID=28183 RepID=UPI000773C218|nr:hypothetical protein [Leptospira santarosai]MDI7198040.1 hypothetical protein [Leptospira santarosai]MDI7204439.1 hypothetical protein [Leptospira santarosai]
MIRRRVAEHILSGECVAMVDGETKKISIKNPTSSVVECWGMRVKFNQANSRSLVEIKLIGQKREITYGPLQLGMIGDARDLADTCETIPVNYRIFGANEIEISLTAKGAIAAGDVAFTFFAEDYRPNPVRPVVQKKPAQG